ncbi:hypothetical protein J2S47_000146 [Streptomyces griseoviridis]|uniref:Uncharacterized protein n=1 Tax=Streptomyces griseoviridis TaxID=45398 RepID=A0ABT9L7F9_STRGD|nr:hypothetical protein [Streptomyces griseoviridis]
MSARDRPDEPGPAEDVAGTAVPGRPHGPVRSSTRRTTTGR